MKKPLKIALACLGGAFVAHFTWFEISNKVAADKAEREIAESKRPLTSAEWEAYGRQAADDKRRYVAAHKGEAATGGLKIGMSRDEAVMALPGGKKDGIYPDIMRFPAGVAGREIAARFVDDSLCYATQVNQGADASMMDFGAHYGGAR